MRDPGTDAEVADTPAAGTDAEAASRLRERAAELDRADPLASFREAFVDAPALVSYLDGNSLGRPLRSTVAHLQEHVERTWGGRLIRAWDEGWTDAPTQLGDLIGRVALGAGPGQTVVGDSTTVLLYKLARAAVDSLPERRVVLADTQNFPTDRFVLEGIAAERGLEVRWLDPTPVPASSWSSCAAHWMIVWDSSCSVTWRSAPDTSRTWRPSRSRHTRRAR